MDTLIFLVQLFQLLLHVTKSFRGDSHSYSLERFRLPSFFVVTYVKFLVPVSCSENDNFWFTHLLSHLLSLIFSSQKKIALRISYCTYVDCAKNLLQTMNKVKMVSTNIFPISQLTNYIIDFLTFIFKKANSRV